MVRGEPDVNVGYSWHIDPALVEFTDTTTEICDGRPSDVERSAITSDRYCPWSAKVVAMTHIMERDADSTDVCRKVAIRERVADRFIRIP